MWHMTACKISVSLLFLNWIKNEMIFDPISDKVEEFQGREFDPLRTCVCFYSRRVRVFFFLLFFFVVVVLLLLLFGSRFWSRFKL